MNFPSFGKIAATAAALTVAGLATTTSASAAWRPYYAGPAHVERVQYYGGPHYGGPRYGGPGWGHHRRHWGPRCWVQRVVRPTPWGREVVHRRVCR